MAVTLANTFESGQTPGTNVTVGNSGGGAGNAFDSVTINATCTCQYTATAYRGSLGCAVSSGGTSGQGAVNWTTSIGTALPHAYGRLLVNASSFTVAFPFMRIRGGAAVQVSRLAFDTSGHIQIRNSSNSTVGTSTTALNTGQWYLIRWDITVGSSATGIVYIHTDPTSPTPTETLTVNSANFNTNNINEYNAGIGASTLNVPTFNFDDIVLTDQGVPGPPLQSVTCTDSWTTSDSPTRTLLLPRSVTDAFTTSDTATKTQAFNRAVTDAFTTSDTATRGLLLPRSVADSVTTTDVASQNVTLPRAVTDTWTTSDAATRATALPRGVSDGWTTADTAARSLVLQRAVADGWLSADEATRSIVVFRTTTDTWTTTDEASAEVLHPVPIVFTLGVPGTRWYPAEPVSAWSTSAPTTRWAVTEPMTQQFSALAKQLVPVPVQGKAAGQPINPTADSVSLAFMDGRAEPADSDWVTGSWDTTATPGVYLAQALIGPGTSAVLTPGTYSVWVKIVDDPETPVFQCGAISVY